MRRRSFPIHIVERVSIFCKWICEDVWRTVRAEAPFGAKPAAGVAAMRQQNYFAARGLTNGENGK